MKRSWSRSLSYIGSIGYYQEKLLARRAELMATLEELDAELEPEWAPDRTESDGPGDGGAASHAARRDAEEPSPGRSEGVYVGSPPAVIRGANPHRIEIGLDWLRLSGPNSIQDLVRQVLTSYYCSEPEPCKGLFLYERGESWHGGVVKLLHDTEESAARHNGRFTVEIPGGGLQIFETNRRVELLRDLLEAGMKATRIDVSVDLIGEGKNTVFLVDEVLAGCQRKELIGARKWRPMIERTAMGELTGATVYLGKRGEMGSGRMVRAYDKGLEQGFGVPNWWHRWEAEFCHDTAEQVSRAIASEVGTPDAWEEIAVSCAVGAVDFKTFTGARDSCRRPRAPWFAEFVSLAKSKQFRVKVKRRLSTLAGWRRWMAKAVMPTLQEMATEAECSIGDLVAGLPVIKPRGRRADRAVMAEFRRELSQAAESFGNAA